MGLYHRDTLAFVGYLNSNRPVSSQIRAAPDKTLLYAGDYGTGVGGRSMWREIALQKRTNPELRDKEMLSEVLARIHAPGTKFANLLEYIYDLESRVPPRPDAFKIWRVVSGIFAANATGKVSFQIGAGVTVSEKVFASTEIRALMKNPNIDPVAKDLLAYYERCVASKQSDINVGFISA